MQSARGLILFAHGSRDARWREPIEAVARRAQELAPDLLVRCAYLEMVTPDLAGATADLVTAGVRDLEVLPLFLGIGKHLREDLPALVTQLRGAYPGIGIGLRSAIGEDSEVIDLLAQIAVRPPHVEVKQ